MSQFSYRITYVEDDLAPSESEPALDIFYDANFQRSRETQGVRTHELKHRQEIKGKLRARAKGVLPNSACIGFASYVLRNNDLGQPCYVDAGTGHIFVEDIIKGGGHYEKTLPLELHTANAYEDGPPLIKGKIHISIWDFKTDATKLTQCPLRVGATIVNSMQNYVQRAMECEMSMRDTIQGIDGIRMPFDISESGIELVGNTFLPACAYTLVETPTSTLPYWRNVLKVLKARHPDAVHARLDKAGLARLMGLAVTLQPQTYDYVSDEVDRNRRNERYHAQLRSGAENFGDAHVLCAGDCEDTACAIHQAFRALQEAPIPKSEPILADLQRVSQSYIPLLTLAAVHGAKVTDKTEQKGAHMYLTLMPHHDFKEQLERSEQGRAMLKGARINWQLDRELPTLFGEGTGVIDPLGYHDPIAPLRDHIATLPLAGTVKQELPHERGGPSGFYLANVLYYTDEFFRRGINYGGFVQARRAGQHALPTRGAFFEDVLQQKEESVLVPHPPVPARDMQLIRAACAIRVPTRGLLYDQGKAMRLEERFSHKRQLLRTHLERNPSSSSSSVAGVDLFMRPHHFDANFLKALATELKDMRSITVYEEPITSTLLQYRIRVSQ